MSFPVHSNFDQHRDWLLRLREEFDSLRQSAEDGAPVLSDRTAFPEQREQSADSHLPRAFMPDRRPSWASPQQPAAWAQQWGDALAHIEVDDDAPVYRSLGGALDEPAAYSSFGPSAGSNGNCFEGMDTMRSTAAAQGPAAVDELWLSRMPPLLSRQRAFNAL